MNFIKCLILGLCFLLARGAEGQEKITFSDESECGMAGTATSAAGKKLNRLKNRFKLPKEADIDADVTLAAMLAPGDDLTRFDNHKAARIVGFCIDVPSAPFTGLGRDSGLWPAVDGGWDGSRICHE